MKASGNLRMRVWGVGLRLRVFAAEHAGLFKTHDMSAHQTCICCARVGGFPGACRANSDGPLMDRFLKDILACVFECTSKPKRSINMNLLDHTVRRDLKEE